MIETDRKDKGVDHSQDNNGIVLDTLSRPATSGENMSDLSLSSSYAGWRKVPLGDEWAKEFAAFEKSAFRLEVLQAYAEAGEAEVLNKFRNGEVIPANWISEWCSLVSSNVDNGKSMARVHLVNLPLSEYLHFEIQHGYRHTLKAGEDISIIDSSLLPVNHGFTEDFWLFDDNKVMVQIYNNAGTMQFSYLNDDPAIVERYVQIQEAALRISEPVQSFYQRESGIIL